MKIAPPGRATPGAPTIATHVWRLFGASALMVAVLVAALFWDIKHIAALRVATVQTAAVDRELRMLGEALLNAETGQRGYLLTADPRYLEPYQLGATAARKSLAALDESALAPEVRRELPQLARLVDEKLAELEVTVTLTREGHRDAAVAVVAQDHGKVLMDGIRSMRNRMLALEFDLYQQRRGAVDSSIFNATLTLLLGSAALIALLFLNTRTATRKLGRPVEELVTRIRDFTTEAGDTPHAAGADEIGWISHEFDLTVERLKKVALERDSALADLRATLQSLRRSEAELRDRESRLSTVVENIPAMISYLDRDGRYQFVNANYCDWTGLDPAQLLGRTVQEVHGDAIYSGFAPLMDSLLAGQVQKLEQRIERPTGTHWVSASMVPQLGADGRVAGFYSFSYDVTERHEAELALLESRRKLQLIIDHVPGLVASLDRDLRYRFVNHAYAEWFGVDPQTLIGMSVREFYGDAVFDGIAWALNAALAGEMVVSERDILGAGVLRHCHVVLVPERDAGGSVTGVFAIHTDITQRKRLERDLEFARDLYQSLYEATPTMLHSVDAQGRLVSVSDTWLRKLGYERAQVIGRPSGAFLSAESRMRSLDVVLPELFKTGRCSNVHLQMIRSDGSPMEVLLSAVVQRDASGHALRSLCVVEDISETLASSAALKKEHALRLEIEQRVAELDSLLAERNEMLYVLAHEVRQPLNNASAVLQNSAAMLTEKGQDLEAGRIHKAQGLMGAILADIDNTLAAAALVAVDGPPEVIDTDVDTLVSIAIGDMPPADRPRVRVVRQTATRTASMDPGLMRLVLRNLLSNSLRYSPAGSPVTIHIADSDEPLALVFEVADEGEGVPPDMVPSLFERGTRGTRSRHEAGHGLGLYIVRRIMEMHGGRVDLVRNGPTGAVMRTVVPQASID